MAEPIYFLTETDRTRMRKALDWIERAQQNVGRTTRPEDDPTAPEQYLFLSPTGGVPARSGTTPGYAVCSVYVVKDRETSQPVLDTGGGKQCRVFNLSETAIPQGTYFTASRDKFGTWVAGAGGGNGEELPDATPYVRGAVSAGDGAGWSTLQSFGGPKNFVASHETPSAMSRVVVKQTIDTIRSVTVTSSAFGGNAVTAFSSEGSGISGSNPYLAGSAGVGAESDSAEVYAGCTSFERQRQVVAKTSVMEDPATGPGNGGATARTSYHIAIQYGQSPQYGTSIGVYEWNSTPDQYFAGIGFGPYTSGINGHVPFQYMGVFSSDTGPLRPVRLNAHLIVETWCSYWARRGSTDYQGLDTTLATDEVGVFVGGILVDKYVSSSPPPPAPPPVSPPPTDPDDPVESTDFTVTVTVLDRNGDPVDNRVVMVQSSAEVWQLTNSSGVAVFTAVPFDPEGVIDIVLSGSGEDPIYSLYGEVGSGATGTGYSLEAPQNAGDLTVSWTLRADENPDVGTGTGTGSLGSEVGTGEEPIPEE